MSICQFKELCGRLYEQYNRREFVHPDPLEALYEFADSREREIVALLASSLAYGRVNQIVRNVFKALEPLRPSPFEFLMSATPGSLLEAFRGFRHRFTDGADLSILLWGARRAIETHGSLQACFARGMRPGDENVLPGLSRFVGELRDLGREAAPGGDARGDARGDAGGKTYLLPSPQDGSACKRLNLFLRWMVREDEVDPGGWTCVAPSKLIMPLDTHIHRIARRWSLTDRKQADLRTAIEVTAAFRKIAPEDPVRYDFVLARSGIRGEDLQPLV